MAGGRGVGRANAPVLGETVEEYIGWIPIDQPIDRPIDRLTDGDQG